MGIIDPIDILWSKSVSHVRWRNVPMIAESIISALTATAVHVYRKTDPKGVAKRWQKIKKQRKSQKNGQNTSVPMAKETLTSVVANWARNKTKRKWKMGRMSDLDIERQENKEPEQEYPDCLTAIGLAMTLVDTLIEQEYIQPEFKLQALHDIEKTIKFKMDDQMTTFYQP